MSEGHQEIQLTEDGSKVVPFAEHVYELRRRLFYIAASIGVGTAAAYVAQKRVVAALLKPAHGQHFIYTSPAGGIDFLFRVCLYAGIAISIPVIVYQFLRYMEPVFPKRSFKFIFWGTAVSGLLALAGISFGYFVGLPHAMNFLLHQTVTAQIQPLLIIQSYISFVTRYMLGSALMFQLPLILIFINRIKPLKPRKLLRQNRWVILGAFVISGLMNPTPRIYDQLLIAGPLILMYQLSIVIIALINRVPKPKLAVVPVAAQPAVAEPVKLALPPQPKYLDFITVPVARPTLLEPRVVTAPAAVQPQPVAYYSPSQKPGIRQLDGRAVISDFFVPKRSAVNPA